MLVIRWESWQILVQNAATFDKVLVIDTTANIMWHIVEQFHMFRAQCAEFCEFHRWLIYFERFDALKNQMF